MHQEQEIRKMVYLKEVTKENIDEVLELSVREDQKSFVSTTAESLAQAYAYKETAFPFAVYNDDTMVGFIMMGYYEAKNYYTLWKFLIDKKYQHMGYGREALMQGISFMRDKFNIKEIYTGVAPGNSVAKGLYQSIGFEDTGLIEFNMEEMCLKL